MKKNKKKQRISTMGIVTYIIGILVLEIMDLNGTTIQAIYDFIFNNDFEEAAYWLKAVYLIPVTYVFVVNILVIVYSVCNICKIKQIIEMDMHQGYHKDCENMKNHLLKMYDQNDSKNLKKFINIFTIIICILAGIYYIYFDYEEMVRHVMTLMINIETCVAMAFTLIASNCSQILYDKYSS